MALHLHDEAPSLFQLPHAPADMPAGIRASCRHEGHKESAFTAFGRARAAGRRASPVLAAPSTSRPVRRWGMVLACTSVMCTKPISWMASCVWGVSSREANSVLLMIPLTVAACLSTPSSEAPALACSRGAVVRFNVHVRYQTQAGNCSGDHDLAQCGGGPLCALNRCSGQCLQVAQPGHTCQNCMLCSHVKALPFKATICCCRLCLQSARVIMILRGHNLAVHLSEMPGMIRTAWYMASQTACCPARVRLVPAQEASPSWWAGLVCHPLCAHC